ncbi:contractile injection system protein, VgrG/Pvc8 family [Anaeromicropila populeti]|uniref:Phage late control gene D protein (GPD) n=1 Tax=Anaeromicropila populeti TaxID=37658 RepID=A0A1I6HTL0_9FIRM|nr:contractile injection system protein, VgrG/Pvc8 family [Anaeromicropila populeti]SFR57764.1 Phage late control gene D protein (GPD) [Anaeromicropila populeti]
METGTFENLRVELPVKLIELVDVQLEERLGEHGTARIVGILAEGEEKNAMDKLTMKVNAKILLKGRGEQKIVFSGVPTKVSIAHAGNTYHIEVTIQSYSILMDLKRKSKSFQNKSQTYTQIFQYIVSIYGGEVKDLISNGKTQNNPHIQWKETDWEFLKRMASHFGAYIYPLIEADKPKIFVGISKTASHTINETVYEVKKNLSEYWWRKENDIPISEKNDTAYEVETTEHYELGDQAVFQGRTFIIARKWSGMKQGRLVHVYELVPEEGLKTRKRYQEEFSGASVEGKIIAREKDKLKLHLSIDEMQEEAEAYWYSFSTSYTAEGATGWYAMPETGQSVQLFFPDRDETKAYITKGIRKDGENNPKTQDVSTKYFGTKEGKEMVLSPSGITFHVLQNETTVQLSNHGGVTISSPKPIQMNAGETLSCDCKNFSVTSKDKIALSTKGATIVVDNITHIIGS